MRLTQSFVNFSTVAHERTAAAAVGVANTSGRPLRFGTRAADGERDSCGRSIRGRWRRALRARSASSAGCRRSRGSYGTLRDVLTLRIEGADSRVPLVTHAVATDNPHLSNEISAPKAVLTNILLNLVRGNARNANVESVFTVANEGDG